MCRPAHRPLKYTFHATVGPISGIAYVTSRSFHQGLASVGHGSCEAGGQGCSRAQVRRLILFLNLRHYTTPLVFFWNLGTEDKEG